MLHKIKVAVHPGQCVLSCRPAGRVLAPAGDKKRTRQTDSKKKERAGEGKKSSGLAHSLPINAALGGPPVALVRVNFGWSLVLVLTASCLIGHFREGEKLKQHMSQGPGQSKHCASRLVSIGLTGLHERRAGERLAKRRATELSARPLFRSWLSVVSYLGSHGRSAEDSRHS